MKKILFFGMICAMGLSFAACEPQLIDGPDAYATVDEAALAEAITYTQYADKELTQPDPAGNFVKYNSSVGVVQVFSMTGASPLVTGAGGTFKLPVKRGHVGNISMRFRLWYGAPVSTLRRTPMWQMPYDRRLTVLSFSTTYVICFLT